MGRIIGIDVGTKRIGVAVSDPAKIISSPYKVLASKSLAADVAAVAALCTEVCGEKIIVGLPLNMNGTQGPAAAAALAFAAALREKVAVPVEMLDERLSTSAAERSLIEGDMRREKRRQVIDKVAAQIILQSYLEREEMK